MFMRRKSGFAYYLDCSLSAESEKINIMRAETHLGICNMRTEGALFNLTLQLPVAKLWSNKS